MVSRRNFLYIFIMMAVLLFMFQFSQVIKENGNNYDVNEFVAKQTLSGENQWRDVQDVSHKQKPVNCVLFWGDEGSQLEGIVAQWCTYTKRHLIVYKDGADYDFKAQTHPELILIDSESINFQKETEQIIKMTEAGIPMIFCNLPEVEALKKNDKLLALLGITQIREDTVTVEGVHLFSGFLLGGEALYKAQNKTEEDMQNLELDLPWFELGKGAKTYMVGLLSKRDVTYNKFPKIIWRNYYNDTMIFAVNGDYMSELTGLGILEAIVYESNSYTVYPVINAQNVILADFPRLSSENAEKIRSVYSREPSAVFRDVMWPSIVSMVMNDKIKLTCCFSTKYDYTETAEPTEEVLPFYLQQLKEMNAEAGRSLNFGEGISLEEKIQADEAFYQSLESNYEFCTLYTKEISHNMRELLAGGEVLKDVRTIATSYTPNAPLVSYYQDGVTLQGVMGDAKEYSYASDLQLRSVITALGYSNLVLDMNPIIWPETEEDQWENYFDKIYSNVSTYWIGFEGFSRTTLSESDFRIRTFLNLDYESERKNNVISMSISGESKEAWFILRLHGEEIEKVENAEYEKLEEGAFLIHTLSQEAKIYLKNAKDVLKYQGPFRK